MPHGPVVQARRIVLHTSNGRYYCTNPATGRAGWRPKGMIVREYGSTGNTLFISTIHKGRGHLFAVRETNGVAEVFRVHPGHFPTLVVTSVCV